MKLVDCDISIRLLNILRVENIETVEELMDVYEKYGIKTFLRLSNFGKKSLKELEELIDWVGSPNYNEFGKGLSRYEIIVANEKLAKIKKKKDKIKTVGKLLNKVLFYEDEIDYEKLRELSKRLEKLVK